MQMEWNANGNGLSSKSTLQGGGVRAKKDYPAGSAFTMGDLFQASAPLFFLVPLSGFRLWFVSTCHASCVVVHASVHVHAFTRLRVHAFTRSRMVVRLSTPARPTGDATLYSGRAA
jgi:hypothetical protein